MPTPGKLKWHFQFTPHDEFDYDSTQVPVLADIEWQGRPRKVMLWANRNGFWYVLDRATGEFLSGKPFAKVTWATGLDAKGRPQNVVKTPTRKETLRLSASCRRDELVLAVVQPANRTVLRARLDGTVRDLCESSGRVRRRAVVSRRISGRHGAEHQRHAGQPPAAETRATAPSSRSIRRPARRSGSSR